MLPTLSSPAPGRAAGTGLSAALHLAALALIIFGLPDLPHLPDKPTAIPVEFLQLPEPQPQVPVTPQTAEKPPAEETTPPDRARPTLEDVRPDGPNKDAAAPQEAKRTDQPDDGVGKPDDKTKVIGRWLLEPLTIKHTGHPCGDATESGTLELIGERGPGAFHGTLRTHVRWTRCAPQIASYYVELRIKGDTVLMVGSGFADSGTVSGDTMSLRDAYGVSLWRKQKLPPQEPNTRR
ncbi:MAG TPA: hypothetical protein VMV26_19950 [Alphaproteobacteria bacterium]|nr:hypothetical protein [Alphaproteobacteria bacterium]